LAAVIVFVARNGGDNDHKAIEHHARGDGDRRRSSARASFGLYGSRRWQRRQQQQQQRAWFVPYRTEPKSERRQFVFGVER